MPSGTADAAVRLARQVAGPLGPRAALVVTWDGAVVAVDGLGDEAVEARSWRSGPDRTGLELVPARDAFGELHDAFLVDVVEVAVAAKAVVRDPVVVVHVVEAPDASPRQVASFPHTLVQLGPSAQAAVLELVVSTGDGAALVVPVTELHVADDAHLSYANVQLLGTACWQIATQVSDVGRDGVLRSFTAGLGSHYGRVLTDSRLTGHGGHASLLAAYLGTDEQVHDFRTLQHHEAPHTSSELLFKGAVADQARSVYSGLIRIRRGARGADAFQTNHNLVLSEGAHADSVPNLDIEENDVRCSHASTVGPIDEDQRVYLESRGIEPAVAERLVVLGFFSDLAARAPIAGVGSWLDGEVARRLGTRIAPGAAPGSGGNQLGTPPTAPTRSGGDDRG